MKEKILIFGDSYSTFRGYVPEGFAIYYCTEGRSPEEPVTKMDIDETWWRRLINATGAEIVQNNSWSGSTVCYTGYSGDCSHSQSFIYRYRKLCEEGFFEKNQVDTVLVFGGTNDSWAKAPLGELKYSDFKEEELFSVLPAMAYFMDRLKRDLPDSRIVFIANCDINPIIIEGIKTAGEHLGVEVIELRDIDKQRSHPTVKGMEQIFEQVYAALGYKNTLEA